VSGGDRYYAMLKTRPSTFRRLPVVGIELSMYVLYVVLAVVGV